MSITIKLKKQFVLRSLNKQILEMLPLFTDINGFLNHLIEATHDTLHDDLTKNQFYLIFYCGRKHFIGRS